MTFDFDKEFAAAQRRHKAMMRIAMAFNLIVFVGVVGGLIWLGWALFDMGPRGIGEFIGQILDGVNATNGGSGK